MIIETTDIGAGDYADVLSTINLLEQSFDEGNFEVHAKLIHPEFRFTSPFGSFATVPDYMTWLQSFYATVQAQGGTRHVVTNPMVRILGEVATMYSYLIILNRTSMTFMGTSVLKDVLRKDDGRWRCVSRVIASDQFAAGASGS